MDSFFPEIQIPPDLLTEFRKYGQRKTFKPKDIIIFQGQHIKDLYYIEAGFIKYTLFSNEGGVQTICYLGNGFFLGDYPYINGGDISTVTIEAATDLRLLVFGQNVKISLYELDGFKKQILRNMAFLTRLIKTQIESISLNSAEQRIQKTITDAEKHFTFFGKKKGDKFHLTKKEVADLSGCSLETVNRFIKTHKKKD